MTHRHLTRVFWLTYFFKRRFLFGAQILDKSSRLTEGDQALIAAQISIRLEPKFYFLIDFINSELVANWQWNHQKFFENHVNPLQSLLWLLRLLLDRWRCADWRLDTILLKLLSSFFLPRGKDAENYSLRIFPRNFFCAKVLHLR